MATSHVSDLVYKSGQHIPQLDGLRGFAILLVTLYRFGRDVPESSAGWIVPQLLDIGAHGVELFFVLSGFLITGILLDSRGTAHQLRNFFVRRSLRILPLYFASLVLFLWMVPLIAKAYGATSIEQAFAPARDQQIFLWLYMTNVQMSLANAWCFGPLDHFWSLAVEEHFYLLWPLAVVFMRSRQLIAVSLALWFACVTTRTGWLATGGAATAAEVLTLWRCDGLLMGALMAVAIRSSTEAWHRVGRVTRVLWLPLLCGALAIELTDRRLWMLGSVLWNGVWFCLLTNMLGSCQRSWLGACFRQAWLRGLGQLSYGMYVFQSPLIPLAAGVGWTVGVSLPQNLLYVGSMFAVTIGVAWCSWHGFERHWLRLKECFPQTEPKVAEATKIGPQKTAWGLVRPVP